MARPHLKGSWPAAEAALLRDLPKRVALPPGAQQATLACAVGHGASCAFAHAREEAREHTWWQFWAQVTAPLLTPEARKPAAPRWPYRTPTQTQDTCESCEPHPDVNSLGGGGLARIPHRTGPRSLAFLKLS